MRCFWILLLVINGFANAQTNAAEYDTAKFSFYFGGGANIHLILANKNTMSPYEAFATERKNGGFYEVGVGYRFSQKWSTFFEFRYSNLRLNKEGYVQRLESLYSNSHVYHDFDVDATNSTLSGLSFSNFCIRQFLYVEHGKFKFTPSLGLGIRYAKTRGFMYTVRPKNSNEPTFYALEFKNKIDFSVSPELAFSYKDWPFSVYFGTELGNVTIKYKVKISDDKELIAQEDYRLKLQYLPLYFGIRLELFNDYSRKE
jgi:hypothetical protein